jgi:hypothetical protein
MDRCRVPEGAMPTTQGEGGSLAAARADIGALRSEIEAGIAALAPEAVAELLSRIDAAYDEFPELELEQPRRKLFERLRAAAATLPDHRAAPLLLFCAALEPASSASLIALCERLADAESPAALIAVLRLLHRYRPFGWITELLKWQGPPEALLAAISEVLDRPALAAADQAARAGSLAQARQPLLSMAERLAELLSLPAPTPPQSSRPAAWPSGHFAFIEFLAQWPAFSLEVPAKLLQTSYASLTPQGALRAETHRPSSFCYGPRLNLPSGRYRLQIHGETGANVEFSVSVSRFIGARQTVVAQRRLSSLMPLSGIIAEVSFDSSGDMPLFEIVIDVNRPSGLLSVSSISIEGRQLQEDIPYWSPPTVLAPMAPAAAGPLRPARAASGGGR